MTKNHEEKIIDDAKFFLAYGKDIESANNTISGLLRLLDFYKDTMESARALLQPKTFYIYDNPALNISLSSLHLSARTARCLEDYNDTLKQPIVTIGDIVRLQHSELLKIPNFGRKSLRELVEAIEARGVEWRTYGNWGDAVKQRLAI